MNWHYLPVCVIHKGERTYSLCEVYLKKDGRLDAWTESKEIAAIGNNLDDLRGSLVHMLTDAFHWKPVKFGDLRRGMRFERADAFVVERKTKAKPRKSQAATRLRNSRAAQKGGDTSVKSHPLVGAMKGLMSIPPGVDLTKPADPYWGRRGPHARRKST